MSKQKVLHPRNLPTRPPLTVTAVVWLLLDRLHAPGYAVGAIWTFVGFLWVAFIVGLFNEEMVDMWPKERK
jgi:hypothetical protein